MTDINHWEELVTCVQLRNKDSFTGEWQDYKNQPSFNNYIQIPVNAYQIGNLLGAIARTTENGDWWGEICSILGVAMAKAGIKEVTSNFGDTFTLEQVFRGNLTSDQVK